MTGRSINSALVRSQQRIGLCPKMKNHPLCGWIFITLKKEKSDMLQKELAKRLKARYDTKMDGDEWMEVPSSIACVVA